MSRFPASFTAITDGWTVVAVDGPIPEGFSAAPVEAVVPGCVHTDLARAGRIAPPFDGDNEAAQQWIGSTVWQYRTGFEWHDDGSDRHDLVAYGLDTVADITLNGVVVGRTENQHRSYRFDVRAALRDGDNDLVVTFAAPVTEVERREAEHGSWPRVNHHPFNMLRKTASNFGWDWGIDVATSGIWQPIGIDSWSTVRVAAVRPLVDVDGTDGVLTAHVDLERDGEASGELEARVTVAGVEASARVAAGQSSAVVLVRVPDARLWWPVGHGEQPLYDVAVSVGAPGPGAPDTIATWSSRVGFRTVALDTSADRAGNRFELVVNGRTILIRGANWIPDHAFVTEIDRARLARRFDDALEANMNLLRVWGGGFYESEDFYELADERGILVWQDFLFACAAYSEEAWLADEVEAEAREQITRLSTHASLVLWNGNNENIWGYVEWGWREALGDRGWGDGYYRHLLPDLVAELDPTRPYSPGSPFSYVDYAHPNDERNGTMHIWDVWNERDYTAYRDYRPRFASEFGFQGPPAWSTLTSVVHDQPLEKYGAQLLVHQKAEAGNLKLDRGMLGHLPDVVSIEDWHWATQLNQAHAVRFGIEHFRSLTPHNTGTIVWQLNDDWPVVSWAAVDFDEHRKPLWYALRDAYRPRLATLQPRDGSLALVLVNDTAESVHAAAVLRRLSFDGTVLAEATVPVAVSARCAATFEVPPAVTVFDDPASEVLVAEVDGFERVVHNPAEVAEQRLRPDAAGVDTVAAVRGFQVTVTAASYLRDLFVHTDRVDPLASVDRGLVTLLPGESVVFEVASDAHCDTAAFASPLVVRSANDLVASGALSEAEYLTS